MKLLWRLLQGEPDIDRGRGVVFILHFSFGQCRLIHGAPQHRLQSFIDAALGDEFPELAEDRGLIGRVHREVGMLPVAQDAQTLEFITLNLVILLGVLAAELADLKGVEALFLDASLFQYFMLDWPPVAVPPRDVRRPVASHRLRLDVAVLSPRGQGMAGLGATIRLAGSAMQDRE